MRTIWPWAWKPRRTDEDHVQRIRRSVAVWDRWRRWFVTLYAVIAVAFLGILAAAAYLVDQLQRMMQGNNVPVVWLGFIVGLLLGTKLGLLALGVAHALVLSLRSLRTEKLMLRYHDALSVLAKENADKEGTRCVVS